MQANKLTENTDVLFQNGMLSTASFSIPIRDIKKSIPRINPGPFLVAIFLLIVCIIIVYTAADYFRITQKFHIHPAAPMYIGVPLFVMFAINYMKYHVTITAIDNRKYIINASYKVVKFIDSEIKKAKRSRSTENYRINTKESRIEKI